MKEMMDIACKVKQSDESASCAPPTANQPLVKPRRTRV